MTKRNIVLTWYSAVLLITGVLLLPHFVWQGAAGYSVSFTQFGPFFAVLLIIRLTHDKDALYEIKNGLRFKKHSIVWYMLSAAGPLVLTGISAVLHTVFYSSKYHAWSGTPVFIILNFAAMLIGSIGEEVGWRGYLLPLLNKKTSPFLSSVILGCLWGLWHMNYAGNIVFWLLFIVITIELSVLFTFLLNKTDGNLWTAVIFHTFFNFASRLFAWERFSTEFLIMETAVFGSVCAAVVLVLDKEQMFRKPV